MYIHRDNTIFLSDTGGHLCVGGGCTKRLDVHPISHILLRMLLSRNSSVRECRGNEIQIQRSERIYSLVSAELQFKVVTLRLLSLYCWGWEMLAFSSLSIKAYASLRYILIVSASPLGFHWHSP